MSYKDFFKVWLEINVANWKNIRYDLVKLLPILFIIPTLIRVADIGKICLIIINLMGMSFVSVVRIRPPKIAYIMPVSEIDRQKYVVRGYWSRVVIAELIYMIVSVLLLVTNSITKKYFCVGNIICLILLLVINQNSMIQIDRVPSKKNTHRDTMFYSTVEIMYDLIVFLFGVLLEVLSFSKNDGNDALGVNYSVGYMVAFIIFISISVLGLIIFYIKKYKERIQIAASYEELEHARRKLSIG